MRIYTIIFVALLISACSEKAEQDTAKTQSGHATMSQTVDGNLSWTVPVGWVSEEVTSSMRLAQFKLSAAEGDPEDGSVVVYYFKGEGGGVEENIRRWTGQFKQPLEQAPEIQKTEVSGMRLTVMDAKGTYLFKPMPMASTATEKPGFRMLAAVLEGNGGPWFVKFTGPEKTVWKWEGSFREFLGSLKLAS